MITNLNSQNHRLYNIYLHILISLSKHFELLFAAKVFQCLAVFTYMYFLQHNKQSNPYKNKLEHFFSFVWNSKNHSTLAFEKWRNNIILFKNAISRTCSSGSQIYYNMFSYIIKYFQTILQDECNQLRIVTNVYAIAKLGRSKR